MFKRFVLYRFEAQICRHNKRKTEQDRERKTERERERLLYLLVTPQRLEMPALGQAEARSLEFPLGLPQGAGGRELDQHWSRWISNKFIHTMLTI